MNKKKIILFRHGQTDWNLEGRVQGQEDIPLNQTGKEQAQSLAEQLKGKDIEIIISSDLCRAHETAIIVGKHHNIPVITAHELREIHVGVAQGALKKDLPTAYWTQLTSNDPCYDHIKFDQGETKRDAQLRISRWLTSYLTTTPYTRSGICAHGRILQLLLLEIGYTQVEHLKNAGFIEIEV